MTSKGFSYPWAFSTYFMQMICKFIVNFGDKLDEGLALIQRATRTVSKSATGALLKLNAGKTKAIVFGNNRYVNSVMSNSSLCIDLGDGIKISLFYSVESLGVILDSRLTWKNHVHKVAKNFNSVLYYLRFFRKYTTEARRKQLVEALLFPHLDYCSVVLLDASQGLRRRLQVMQNSGVRYVMGLKRDDHVSPHRSSRIVRMCAPDCLVGLFTRHVPRERVTYRLLSGSNRQ